MKNAIRMLLLAAAAAGPLAATPAAAQLDPMPLRSSTTGFNLGLFLNGSAVQVENSDVVESGGGLGVHLGYGFSEAISVFLRVDVASIRSEDVDDDYAMAHADLGARFSFGRPTSPVRPYLQAALGGRAFSWDTGPEGELQVRGSALSAGAGLEYFLNPDLAIEGGLHVSYGDFSEGRLDGGDWVDFGDEAFSATTTRFDLGVSWHP